MQHKNMIAGHWGKRELYGLIQSVAEQADSCKSTRRVLRLANRFLDYFLLFVFLAFAAISAWLFITMPAGSRDPHAPLAGQVPHLGWLLSLFPSILPDGPLKCGNVYLYSSIAPADRESRIVIVSTTPPDDSKHQHILQLWAFDPAHSQNGHYRSLYDRRSLDRSSLRPVTFAELPVSHVEGYVCWPHKPFALKCAPDSPFC